VTISYVSKRAGALRTSSICHKSYVSNRICGTVVIYHHLNSTMIHHIKTIHMQATLLVFIIELICSVTV
jgi:hypothetical protein